MFGLRGRSPSNGSPGRFAAIVVSAHPQSADESILRAPRFVSIMVSAHQEVRPPSLHPPVISV
jgi:hypothetical protein